MPMAKRRPGGGYEERAVRGGRTRTELSNRHDESAEGPVGITSLWRCDPPNGSTDAQVVSLAYLGIQEALTAFQ